MEKSIPQLNSFIRPKWLETSDVLGVFHEQPCYEVFGQDTCVAEELLIERVVHSWDIG